MKPTLRTLQLRAPEMSALSIGIAERFGPMSRACCAAVLSSLFVLPESVLAQSQSDTAQVLEAVATSMRSSNLAVGTVNPELRCHQCRSPRRDEASATYSAEFARVLGARLESLTGTALSCDATTKRCVVKGGGPYTTVQMPKIMGDSAVVVLEQLLGGRLYATGARSVWERSTRYVLVRERARWKVKEVKVVRQS